MITRCATFSIAMLLVLASSSYADTIHVPADQPTIQAGIDTAVNGDIVLVAPGTYEESIDFKGKAVLLKSGDGAEATVITNILTTKVYIRNKEGPDTILDGFTIRSATSGLGIYCQGSSPTIRNNIIENNHAGPEGGGIHCSGGSPVIMNNIIRNNTSHYGYLINSHGGGIYIGEYCNATIKNNVLYGNIARGHTHYGNGYGGAIYFNGESLILTDNIIMDNQAELGWGDGVYCAKKAEITNNLVACNHGQGIRCRDDSVLLNNTIVKNAGVGLFCGCYNPSAHITVQNTITWYNDDKQIEFDGPGGFSVTYCNVQDGLPGTGNIDSDPLFVDPANNDFHLTYPSPCRDSGDNTAVTELYDFEGDPRIAYGTVDMGADEFYTHLYLTGDQTPGGSIQGKLVGLPGTTPVGLFIGTSALPSPIPTMWGEYWLQAPWFLFPLVPIPSNGILELPTTLPGSIPAPYDVPIQALIGLNADSLTNLEVLEVR